MSTSQVISVRLHPHIDEEGVVLKILRENQRWGISLRQQIVDGILLLNKYSFEDICAMTRSGESDYIRILQQYPSKKDYVKILQEYLGDFQDTLVETIKDIISDIQVNSNVNLDDDDEVEDYAMNLAKSILGRGKHK